MSVRLTVPYSVRAIDQAVWADATCSANHGDRACITVWSELWKCYKPLVALRFLFLPCSLWSGSFKKMSSKNKKWESSEAFCRPSLAVQKTSAEIINEARNALRTLRTRRPFTPREEQRKLFGSASSRTPENRPPSSFRYGGLGKRYIFCLSREWDSPWVYFPTVD